MSGSHRTIENSLVILKVVLAIVALFFTIFTQFTCRSELYVRCLLYFFSATQRKVFTFCHRLPPDCHRPTDTWTKSLFHRGYQRILSSVFWDYSSSWQIDLCLLCWVSTIFFARLQFTCAFQGCFFRGLAVVMGHRETVEDNILDFVVLWWVLEVYLFLFVFCVLWNQGRRWWCTQDRAFIFVRVSWLCFVSRTQLFRREKGYIIWADEETVLGCRWRQWRLWSWTYRPLRMKQGYLCTFRLFPFLVALVTCSLVRSLVRFIHIESALTRVLADRAVADSC